METKTEEENILYQENTILILNTTNNDAPIMNLPENQQHKNKTIKNKHNSVKINHVKKKTTNGIAPKQHAAKTTKQYHP